MRFCKGAGSDLRYENNERKNKHQHYLELFLDNTVFKLYYDMASMHILNSIAMLNNVISSKVNC